MPEENGSAAAHDDHAAEGMGERCDMQPMLLWRGQAMLKIGGQRIPTKTLVLLVSEALLIIFGLAFATACVLLRRVGSTPAAIPVARFLVVVLICILALYFNDFYDLEIMKSKADSLMALLQALGIACIALSLIYYIAPDLSLGRGIAALAVPTIVTLVFAWRWVLEIEGFFFLRSPERVLIVGTGSTGIELTREICARPELNLKVLGFLDEKGENIGMSLVNPGIVGGLNDLAAFVQRKRYQSRRHVTEGKARHDAVRELLRLKFAGVSVEDAHTVFERISGRIPLERLSPSWLIFSDGFSKIKTAACNQARHRHHCVAVGILLTLPIMGAVALAILLESGRPVLFRQKRVGLNGEVFEILKFRSMRQDSEKGGPSWATDDDNRITRVGGFIRKYRFDELPQFFNILHGEMSLVGPRPEQPYFCEMLESQPGFLRPAAHRAPGSNRMGADQISVRFYRGRRQEEAGT